MHEMAVTGSIVERVLEYAESQNAQEVREVHIRIGVLRDIVDPILRKCFSYFSKGTIAAEAELVVTSVPLTVKCSKCGAVFPVDLASVYESECVLCGCQNFEIETGQEFFIDSIVVA